MLMCITQITKLSVLLEDKEKYYLNRFSEIYDDKYTYEVFTFNGAKTKIGIICPIHGRFERELTMHKMGRGCPCCGKETRSVRVSPNATREDKFNEFNKSVLEKNPLFLENYDILSYGANKNKCQVLCKNYNVIHKLSAREIVKSKGVCSVKSCTTPEVLMKKKLIEVHDNTLDFSEIEYSGNSQTPLKVKCPKHGYLKNKTFSNLMSGRGCEACGGSKKRNTEEFIKESKKKFGGKFSYEKTKYVTAETKIIITCKKHGDFETTPNKHLNSKYGFVELAKESMSMTHEEYMGVLKQENSTVLDEYNIKDTYKGFDKKLIIEDKEYGEQFLITAGNLLKTKPSIVSAKNPNSLITKKSQKIHGSLYDYSLVRYKNAFELVEIICPVHGVFKQSPASHLSGSGCPKCAHKHSNGVKYMERILLNRNIKYELEKKFADCVNIFPLPFDIWLSNYNTLIEVDGMQHYQPIEKFGGQESFEKLQMRDNIKNQYCLDSGISLKRIPYDPSTKKSTKMFQDECNDFIEKLIKL